MEGSGSNPENYSPVTIDSAEAMVYSAGGRLTIQRITDPAAATWNSSLSRWVGEGVQAPIFSGAAWERTSDGPGSYGAELNVQGKVVYGFIWRTGDLDEGDYRLTFSLDGARDGFAGAGTSLDGATIRTGETVVATAEEGGGNAAVVQGADELTYIDVGLTQGSGSGGGGGGGGGGEVTEDGVSPIFTQSSPPTALTVGTPYSYTFAASGDPAPTFSASGQLPPGLTLNPTTGVLSGTPTQAGTFEAIVTASNGIVPDVDTQTLTFTVSPAIVPSPGVQLPPGAPQQLSVTAANGRATLTWQDPASPGSTPVSGYRADISPGGDVCEVDVPTRECRFEGLANGQTYTFRVQARNSIGYGPYAQTDVTVQEAVDDTAAIMIVATRSRENVQVRGMTEGIPVATQLQTRLNLGDGEQIGARGPLVQDDSTFTWQRRLGEARQFQLRFAYGDVLSNTVNLDPGEASASILVTGTRDRDQNRDRIRIEGESEGLPEMVRLRTRIDIGDGYRDGVGAPQIGSGGDFTWQRRIGAAATARVQFSWGPVTSNVLTFPPRR